MSKVEESTVRSSLTGIRICGSKYSLHAIVFIKEYSTEYRKQSRVTSFFKVLCAIVSENSYKFINQSDSRLKPIASSPPAFSRASVTVICLTVFCFDFIDIFLCSVWFNRNVLYFHLAKNGLYLIKWTINGFSDGLNSLTIVISGAAVLWDERNLTRHPDEWLRRRL